MKLINLLPKSEQKELKLQFLSDQIVMFFIWSIISIVFFGALTYTAKIYLQGEITQTESEIAVERQVLRTSDNELLRQQVGSINSQIVAIRNIQAQHYYWSEALNELARILPPDIVVDSLVADRALAKVDIEGVAGNRESVLQFWSEVHKSPYFQNINFPLANLNFATDTPFTFTFNIVPEKLRNP